MDLPSPMHTCLIVDEIVRIIACELNKTRDRRCLDMLLQKL